MAPNPTEQKWYSLAEQASKETDPEKLTILIAELCSALDERVDLSPTHDGKSRANRPV
jgi:hypothetical protein